MVRVSVSVFALIGTSTILGVVIWRSLAAQKAGYTLNRGEKLKSAYVIVNSTDDRSTGLIVTFSQGSISTNSTVNDSVTPFSFPVDEETS